MSVATIDFDAVYEEITARLEADRDRRLRPPLVRIWDGNWVLRGTCTYEIAASAQRVDNDTGLIRLDLPEDYYLAEWIADFDGRSTKNVHITIDKDGARLSGRLEEVSVDKDDTGRVVIRCLFKDELEELKHIYCWCNPFLPAEIQFPRLWILFGPAKWALKLTLLVNIMRLESSLWMLPDDPLDPAQWFNFDQSTWSMVVKPDAQATDTSPFAIVHSRFKSFYDVSKRILADGQLSITYRRYLDGDPEPWPGANLRHGCLVWDIEDKSGWTSETSFGGNIFTGLVRAFTTIDNDGLTEGVDIIDDPAFPDEYSQPGYRGTLPQAPGVIYRESERTGIQTSSFKRRPATVVQVVTGGHSMPGVNELISAAIQMAGDLIAAALFIPPVGGATDAILKPLYTDTILAWMAWKSPARAQSLGWSHYHEGFAEGADRAYTLSALIALRTKFWLTREQTSHSLVVADGSPWHIGERGRGHFFVGDRVGSTVRGMPKGRVFVDRVSELTLAWDRESTPAWKITIGQREIEDPVVKAFEAIQEVFSIARELGVL